MTKLRDPISPDMESSDEMQISQSRKITADSKAEKVGSSRHDGFNQLYQKLGPVIVQSLVSIGLLGGSLATFVYLNATRPAAEPVQKGTTQQIVRAAVVEESRKGIDFEVDGVVIPFKRIEVPVEVTGVISKRSDNCRIGRYVHKGEFLVEISSEDYKLEIRRLEEEVKQADATLHELELDVAARERKIEILVRTLKLKQTELARIEKLYRTQAISESDVEASKLEELQALNDLQSETDQLSIAKATRIRLESTRELAAVQLERARIDQQRCTVTSPISGMITQEPAEEGVFLQRGATVATIQDVSTMEIRCSLTMKQMNYLWNNRSNAGTLDDSVVKDSTQSAEIYRIPPTPVTVKFGVDGTEYSWDGSLDYFDGAEVDRSTRLIACRVYVRNPEGQVEKNSKMTIGGTSRISLMTGMFVTLEIHTTPQIQLLKLPEEALYPGNHVWKLNTLEETKESNTLSTAAISSGEGKSKSTADAEYEYSTLNRIAVRVTHAIDNTVFVHSSSELTAGDRVVISPLAAPIDEAVVKIRREE